jgi:drug/metabolite transporter (DMT)-like permease
VRAFFGNFAFVCLNYAIIHMILADAMTLSFTTPLWSILTSALILGDRIRPSRVVATMVGFGGVLFIVKPTGGIEPAALVALLSALSTSLAMIGVKKLSGTEPPTRISFYFIALGAVVLAPFAIATWETPSLLDLVWLAIAGFLTVLGQECLVRAYGYGEVTIIAPMDYLRLPFAAAVGFAVFAEAPDLWSVLGTLVIVATSLYIARVEGRRPAKA